MSNTVLVWLLTYVAHSTILLGVAWMCERAGLLQRPRLAETVWRIALYGGTITATIQVGLSAFELQRLCLHTFVLPSPFNEAAPLIAWLWLVPALFGGVYIVFSVFRLNSAAARYPIDTKPEVSAFLDSLCREIGRKTPTVRINNGWTSPFVLPNGDICVPEWVSDGLSQGQLEAMLAHEMAHVVRRDSTWRIVTGLVCRIGFFQPLNAVAVRRLELLAELCCDDWAARTSGHRRTLADALYTCAEALQTRIAPSLAPAMANHSSPLIIRISTLLEGGSMFMPSTLRAVSILVSAALIAFAAAMTLPAVAIGIDVASSRVTIDASVAKFQSRLDGKIVFTPQEDDVQHLDKPLSISEVIAGKTWAIDFVPGKRATNYSIEGTTRPLDGQGRAWLARVIPELLRETAYDAQGRVKRLFQGGGDARVLAEIDKVRSVHAQAIYTSAYLSFAHPTPPQLAHLLALVHDNAGSDRERAQVYVAALKTQAMNREQLSAVLTGAARMQDSNEICNVLRAVAAVMPNDAGLVRQYRTVARKTDDIRRGQAEKALDHLNV